MWKQVNKNKVTATQICLRGSCCLVDRQNDAVNELREDIALLQFADGFRPVKVELSQLTVGQGVLAESGLVCQRQKLFRRCGSAQPGEPLGVPPAAERLPIGIAPVEPLHQPVQPQPPLRDHQRHSSGDPQKKAVALSS